MSQELTNKILGIIQSRTDRNSSHYSDIDTAFLNKIVEHLASNTKPDESFVKKLCLDPDSNKVLGLITQVYYYADDSVKALYNLKNGFVLELITFVINQFTKINIVNSDAKYFIRQIISQVNTFDEFNFLVKLGYPETEICELVLGANGNIIYADNELNKLNFAGEILQLVCKNLLKSSDKSTFLGKLIGSKATVSEEDLLKFFQILNSRIFNHYQNSHFQLIKFIIENYPSIFIKCFKIPIHSESSHC